MIYATYQVEVVIDETKSKVKGKIRVLSGVMTGLPQP